MKSRSSVHACDVMKQVSSFSHLKPCSSPHQVCRHCPCAAVLYSACTVVTYTSALWQWGFVRYERGQGLFVARYIPRPFPSCSDLVQWENWWLEIWKDRFVLGQCMCVSQHSAWWPPHSIPRVKARSINATCYQHRSVAFPRIRQNIHCKKIASLFLNTINLDI